MNAPAEPLSDACRAANTKYALFFRSKFLRMKSLVELNFTWASHLM